MCKVGIPFKAVAELPNSNSIVYERIYSNRGGYNLSFTNMYIVPLTCSQEYIEYQQNYISQRFDTFEFSPDQCQELAKDPKVKWIVFHKRIVDEARSARQAERMKITIDAAKILQT